MSNTPAHLKDDPKVPLKLLPAAIVAGGTAALGYADVMPQWVLIVLAIVVASAGVYIVPNPKVRE